MSFFDVLAILAFLLAVLESKFRHSIWSWIVHWRSERKFSSLKRELRATRRGIARLKRSRIPSKRSEDWVVVVALAIATLGIVISVLSLAFISDELTKQFFTQRQAFVFVFLGGITVFSIIMFGPNTSTPKHYRFVMQKLESKRKKLVKKVYDAETQ